MKKKRTKLGALLRSTRRSLDLTLQDVSEETGLAISYLSDLEDGNKVNNPSLNTMRALTQLYRLEPARWFET
jgi:transcriptional regulator with XRE-family HTH domain